MIFIEDESKNKENIHLYNERFKERKKEERTFLSLNDYHYSE